AAAAAPEGGYSLLYIEDNPASLRLVEHLVGTLPEVTMLSAPRPQLGLELAVAHRPRVIIVDINLPEMNGFEVLRRLQAMPETRGIPVLALSAAAMPADVKAGLAAGFFAYLTKPLEVSEFVANVEAALSAAPSVRSRNGTSD
ncbi:MAG: response regulator, partial [Alphaproteobacteria bacterium]|nr:response regulator [Alphaproteobacteria bacterium]